MFCIVSSANGRRNIFLVSFSFVQNENGIVFIALYMLVHWDCNFLNVIMR